MQERVVFLDYLRAIAALMVLLAHWYGIGQDGHAVGLHLAVAEAPSDNFLVPLLDIWTAIARRLHFDIKFASGGVLLFFLVSGFVIPMSVEKYGTAAFALRRAARLLPPLWATICLWLALNAVLRAVGLVEEQPYNTTTLVTNALLIHDWYWLPHVDPSFWTLLVEAKFYVAMAAFVILVRRIAIASIAGLCGLIAVFCLPFNDLGTASTYAALFKFTDESGIWWPFYFVRILNDATPFLVFMLIGTVAFLWFKGRLATAAALVAVLVLFAFFAVTMLVSPNGPSKLYFVDDGFKMLFVFAFAMGLEKAGLLRRRIPILSPVLLWLAHVSYSLYLTHGLIGMSIVYSLWQWTGNLNLSVVLGLPIVLALSWAIEKIVGTPAQTFAAKITANPRWLLSH